MFGIGGPELVFIMVLALLIFGPKRLPQIGRTLGKGMAEFRRASTELQRAINTEIEDPATKPAYGTSLPSAPPVMAPAQAPVAAATAEAPAEVALGPPAEPGVESMPPAAAAPLPLEAEATEPSQFQ